ncbi:MAG: diphosphate--fructose-6-phosphate 1-phosphotransferase [Planctomycetota bacterium]
MLTGNAIVGQSGGPTAVINSSLVGIVDAAKKAKAIDRVLGMRFAIEGVLNGYLLDLGAESDQTLKKLRSTPSSALGSSRLKLQPEHFAPILKTLKKYDIRYFFMIGGNDTMDTIHRVVEYANAQGHAMRGIGVSKTVDNDLYGTDHTPGFPSAARYVALSIQQGGILNRDMQKVDQFSVFQTVGRSAGWLPAAAAAARRKAGDPPHIILVPERAFDKDAFLAKVEKTHKRYGYCSIVTGEGVTYADGSPISASQTKDKFGNVEFGAMGGTSAAMAIHKMLGDTFGWRGEFQVVESLMMAAQDRGVKLDYAEAYRCGKKAVQLATSGRSGVMVTIERANRKGQPYKASYGTAPLAKVANFEHQMPDRYIARDGMDVTRAFIDYINPLIGELPELGHLTIRRAGR